MDTIIRITVILLLISFLVLIITAVFKFPELRKYFIFVYDFIPASTISKIHEWSGVILSFLIIIHLILNYRNSKGAFNVVYIIIGVAAISLLAIYLNTKYVKINHSTILPPVEITDYNGEKLGSIGDFPENSIKGPQYINKNTYRLEITGLVSTSTSLSYGDILKLPSYQKVVTLNCVEDWSVKALWEGVLVKDLLKNLSIKPEAKTIIFYAADGYSTSFPLDYIMNNNIIMAYKLNGIELPAKNGFPLHLIAEQKWGYKWIKWITKIELSSDTDYKGFWESRGYNNNGDLTGSKYAQ